MRPKWLCVLALSLAIGASADTLILKNGRQFSGRFVSGSDRSISFDVDGARTRDFDLNEVRRIEFSSSPASADRSMRDDRTNPDIFADDRHVRYDRYRDRPDYRDRQPAGGAVEAKYQDMTNAGLSLGQPISAERTSSDGQGRFRVYQNGAIYWSPRTGAHEVHGAIRDQYVNLGAERSRLGYPTSDEMPSPDGVGRLSHFEHGSIYWSPQTGARVDYQQ